jgi:hypothetical protein
MLPIIILTVLSFSSGLSLNQVDVLWSALVSDCQCSDEALEWFVQQAQSKDLHALNNEALKYIFTEKVNFKNQVKTSVYRSFVDLLFPLGCLADQRAIVQSCVTTISSVCKS